MNIPLNIDWQQILLHLLNFAVLSLGLYILLYKPVSNFMKKRTEHFNGLEKNIELREGQAEDMKKTYEERLHSIDDEIAKEKTKAIKKAEQEAENLLQKAQKKAEGIIADAGNAAQQEREKILQDTQQEVLSLAFAAAEKMMAKSSSDILDQFLHAVEQE